jgi:hypothetical protein
MILSINDKRSRTYKETSSSSIRSLPDGSVDEVMVYLVNKQCHALTIPQHVPGKRGIAKFVKKLLQGAGKFLLVATYCSSLHIN